MQKIFLDANSTVPPLKEACVALQKSLQNQGNASSPHFLGRKQRAVLDLAREQVAFALGCKDKDIFFTSGASEGNRWLVDAIVSKDWGHLPRVLSTTLEHPSLIKPLQHRHASGALYLTLLEPSTAGGISLENNDLTCFDVVIITSAHSETGVLTNWNELLAKLPEHVVLLTDATQSIGRIGPLPKRVDGAVISAHKMGGVAGVGAVLLRNRAKTLTPPWQGGGQEGGLRPGTEPVSLLFAFGKAAELIERTRSQHQKLECLRDHLEGQLLNAWSFAAVLGSKTPRLPNTSAFVLDGVDGEALRIAVDSIGLCVGFGTACSALAPEPSPALLSFGLTHKQAKATIRISLTLDTTKDVVDEALKKLIPVGLALHRA